MGYLTLAQHHGRQVWRSLKRGRRWLVGLAFAPIILYMMFVLAGLGMHFDMLPLEPLGAQTPLDTLNAYLLSGMVGLFTLRFVLQRPPRLSMQPYRHLPISTETLVNYFQGASLCSLLNVLPLFFLTSFWIHHVIPEISLLGAVVWFAGVVAVLIITHYLNSLARILLDRNTRKFFAILVMLVCVLVADHVAGSNLIAVVSMALFNPLADASILLLALLIAGCVGLAVATSRMLHYTLRSPTRLSHDVRGGGLLTVTFGDSPLWNLIVLEWKLMRRTKRPRQYAFVSVVLASLYTGLLLSDLNVLSGPLVYAFLGLFASGAFALNYGQLMFSWESKYFDGILSRAIPLQHMILAKLMLLQISCLVMFLLCLPLFFWLAPRLVPLHVTFLFYNAGITCLLMLFLAVHNEKRVSTSDGNFFNYEGFSIWHWIWLIPTVVPPGVVMMALDNHQSLALAIIAGMGLCNMVLAWPWCMWFARQLHLRRYAMAEGFRQSP